MELDTPAGPARAVYLKRQENHSRFSLRHPIKGEATFAREFGMILHLRKHGVPTLNPLFFGEHFTKGAHGAVLMTEALEGYRALEEMLDDGEIAAMSFVEKRQLLSALAIAVRKMHDANVQHRSLYPKHLMVKRGEGFEVAMIDLEKSRRSYVPYLRMLRDLTTLSRHTNEWSLSGRMYFYCQYLGVKRLGPLGKRFIGWIYGKSLLRPIRSNLKHNRTLTSA
jgi:tRNA A-37 threonylcarbamoyl transferase component Bud32